MVVSEEAVLPAVAEVVSPEAVAEAEAVQAAVAVVAAEVSADKEKSTCEGAFFICEYLWFNAQRAYSWDRAVGPIALCSADHAPALSYTRSYLSPVLLWQSW